MSKAFGRRALLTLIPGLVVALVMVIGYKAWPLVFAPEDVQILPEPGCDLQRARCVATLPDGKIDLEFLTRPIPLARPFRVALATSGIAPSRVELDFAGVEMNMGENRAVLRAVGGGQYAADITLPVCITGPMKWRATVILHARNRRLSIPYEFSTGEVH
ncbi:MAG: hypothetical protein AB7U81_04540 [Thiohalomonadaceae bacterium]